MSKISIETCILCTEVLKDVFLGGCNHNHVCSLCSLRLRFFYKDFSCPICKKENLEVYKIPFEDQRPFEQLRNQSHDLNASGGKKNKKKTASSSSTLQNFFLPTIGVHFRTQKEFEEAKRLTEKVLCPVAGCKQELATDKDLLHHVMAQHALYLCEVCLKSRKKFLFELELYTSRDLLTQHLRASSPGHRFCTFCKEFLFSEDEYHEHMSLKHETCQICLQKKNGKHFFRDYHSLEAHCRSDHFLCEDSTCLASRFAVFPTIVDLKAHMLQVHKAKMSQIERKKQSIIPAALLFGDCSGVQQDESLSWNPFAPAVTYQQQYHNNSHISFSNGIPKITSYASVVSKAAEASESSKPPPPPPPEVFVSHKSSPTAKSEKKPNKSKKSDKITIPSVAPFPSCPEEITKRNMELMNQFKAFFDQGQDGLQQLKTLSTDFRQGKIGSSQYLDGFVALIGEEAVSLFLPELVALLPDPNKRNSLLDHCVNRKLLSRPLRSPRNEQDIKKGKEEIVQKNKSTHPQQKKEESWKLVQHHRSDHLRQVLDP